MAQISIIQKSDITQAERFDAEYFKPEYLEIDRILAHLNTKPINDKSVSLIFDGNHLKITDSFTNDENSIPYYRGQDVSSFFLEDTHPLKIQQETYNKNWMKRSHFQESDILLSIVGTVGNLSIVTNKINKSTGSCKLAILRAQEINSEYLAAFLMSKYGQKQIERNTRGAVQKGLILQDMKYINVLIPQNNVQTEVSDIVQQSIQNNRQAKDLYAEAENLLLAELDLVDYQSKHQLSFNINKTEIEQAQRFDAEYFQPKYNDIIEKIESYAGGFDIVKNQFKQNTTLSKKDKDFYQYIEIGSVNTSNGEIKSKLLAIDDVPANGKKTLLKNDLLISKVRPYRGAIAIVDFDCHNLLGSGAFTVLQEKLNYKKEVLMIFLKTIFIKDLLLKYNVGTSYPVIKDEDILQLKIPLINQNIQNQIAEKITLSHTLRKQSKDLLALAKTKVEQAIEQQAD